MRRTGDATPPVGQSFPSRAPSPIGGERPKPEREIVTLDDVHAALHWYVAHIPEGQVLSTATHLSTDINYRAVSDIQSWRRID